MRRHRRQSLITCGLMDAASDLAKRNVRAALGFHRTDYAVGLPGSEDDGVGFGDVRMSFSRYRKTHFQF